MAEAAEAVAGKPRPGRPLDERTSRAILEAALELLIERGYGAMSMEAVAARAGVGKPAIYRRHADKAELTEAALSIIPIVEAPDTGDTLGDLLELVLQARPLITGPFPILLGNVLAEQHRQPELLRVLRERVISRRREALKTVLRRGLERGEVRPDLDLEQAADAFGGQVLGRHVTGLPFTDEWLEAALEFFWRAVRAD